MRVCRLHQPSSNWCKPKLSDSFSIPIKYAFFQSPCVWQVQNLFKEYHVRKTKSVFKAAQDVSLEFPANEIIALLGPSGSGKTTLLRLIAGLESATSGQIFFGGTYLDPSCSCQHLCCIQWNNGLQQQSVTTSMTYSLGCILQDLLVMLHIPGRMLQPSTAMLGICQHLCQLHDKHKQPCKSDTVCTMDLVSALCAKV